MPRSLEPAHSAGLSVAGFSAVATAGVSAGSLSAADFSAGFSSDLAFGSADLGGVFDAPTKFMLTVCGGYMSYY